MGTAVTRPTLILTLFSFKSNPKSNSFSDPIVKNFGSKLHNTCKFMPRLSISTLPSSSTSRRCSINVENIETHYEEDHTEPTIDFHSIDESLLQNMVHDALVWSSLHGLVVGDKNIQRSGEVPGVGMVHAPFALLPMQFPEIHWRQACEVAPIFNELIDRVSLDAEFLQNSLSRTKKVDDFTSILLDIHMKMLLMNKKEEICLGLHRSDYMLDGETKLLLQIEFNTISSSFPGLACLVSELHRGLLKYYGEFLHLDSKRIPENTANIKFANAIAKAWIEYDRPRSVVLVVVQTKEHNMYDQHLLAAVLMEKYDVVTIRKTLAEIDEEAELLPDGTLLVGGQEVALIYFRSGYAPTDYPSDREWKARLLLEQSIAIKCPSISYHLAGTKKIQQELAKPNVLEKFLENKDDISKIRNCFAGLWSLDDTDIVNDAIKNPELFVMKPQREGGGNNIYGDDVRETLVRLQKEGFAQNVAYILMQRIFPSISRTYLIRDGICNQHPAISELGIYGTYLRNKEKVIINEQCGYLVRTKMSSSNEGGVAAGFAVLDSLYLT